MPLPSVKRHETHWLKLQIQPVSVSSGSSHLKTSKKHLMFSSPGCFHQILKRTSLTIYLQTKPRCSTISTRRSPHQDQPATSGVTAARAGPNHERPPRSWSCCAIGHDWSMMVSEWMSKQVRFQKTKGWWSKWTACVISELRVFLCFYRRFMAGIRSFFNTKRTSKLNPMR